MIRGIYASNMGLNATQRSLNDISFNIANVNTTGFKQQRTSFTTFREALLTVNGKKVIGNYTHGVQPNETKNDFAQGPIQETGRDLDFAIQGEGFFTINTPDGIRYTRCGAFNVDRDGFLVTKEGYRVLGEDEEEIILIDGELDQELLITDFFDRDTLVKVGENLYSASDNALSFISDSKVLQGFLEKSNVDLAKALTEAMSDSRIFALNSRVLMVEDKTLEKAVNEIGNLR